MIRKVLEIVGDTKQDPTSRLDHLFDYFNENGNANAVDDAALFQVEDETDYVFFHEVVAGSSDLLTPHVVDIAVGHQDACVALLKNLKTQRFFHCLFSPWCLSALDHSDRGAVLARTDFHVVHQFVYQGQSPTTALILTALLPSFLLGGGHIEAAAPIGNCNGKIATANVKINLQTTVLALAVFEGIDA